MGSARQRLHHIYKKRPQLWEALGGSPIVFNTFLLFLKENQYIAMVLSLRRPAFLIAVGVGRGPQLNRCPDSAILRAP